MSEEPEAGHIGHGVHARQFRKVGAGAVEAGGEIDHRAIVSGAQLALHEGGREDADAERLTQHQRVPGMRV